MRVRGDLQPSNAFSIEEQPKKPGYCLARFYENAEPFEDHEGGLTIRGWEYDEYCLELFDTGSLQEDILNNYDALLAQAKAEEAERQPLPPRVDTLEEDTASLSEVLNILLGVSE